METALELGVGTAERALGVHIEPARKIDEGEQKIADFFVRRGRIGRCRKLGELFGDLGLDVRLFLPVEADLGRLVLELERAGERGKGEGNSVQRSPLVLAAPRSMKMGTTRSP